MSALLLILLALYLVGFVAASIAAGWSNPCHNCDWHDRKVALLWPLAVVLAGFEYLTERLYAHGAYLHHRYA